LDIGCGTGLLALASKPFLGKDGEFTGIDVMEKNIKFCREHYPPANFKFMHFDVKNTSYAPTQKGFKLTLPAKCESSNLDILNLYHGISDQLFPRGFPYSTRVNYNGM